MLKVCPKRRERSDLLSLAKLPLNIEQETTVNTDATATVNGSTLRGEPEERDVERIEGHDACMRLRLSPQGFRNLYERSTLCAVNHGVDPSDAVGMTFRRQDIDLDAFECQGCKRMCNPQVSRCQSSDLVCICECGATYAFTMKDHCRELVVAFHEFEHHGCKWIAIYAPQHDATAFHAFGTATPRNPRWLEGFITPQRFVGLLAFA